MNKTTRVVPASLAVLMFGCATEPDPVAEVASASRVAEPGRPCRSDAFFVDIPVRNELPSYLTNTNFLTAFATNLELEANAPGKPWFCGAGAVTCPTSAIAVEAGSLLPQRSTPVWRAEGHLRHYRVKFMSTGRNPSRLLVRDEARCHVVSRIRKLFELASGVPASDMLLVGRECDASVSGVEGAPDADMLSWHLTRIGLPVSALDVQPPATSNVDFALVDSGVIASVQAGIGVASEDDVVGTPGRHVHGSALGILARQVAPDAAIHSVRVLDAGGTGTSGNIALGLDQLLFDNTSTAPLVINLSLGWPSQLAEVSRLVGEYCTPGQSCSTGQVCSTFEDAYGESVRYVLEVARRMDVAGTRPIFVASSAGNLPLPPNPALFPTYVGPSGPDPDCTEAPPTLFFPAEWSRTDTCQPENVRRERLTVAVSATDDRNRRAQISIPGEETPIVAPGQHVYAAYSGAPATSEAPVCSGATMSFPPAVTLPVALTGTSVSAALVSAAAARAQARLQLQGSAPLKRTALARLIYLTGTPVCRNTSNGTPVRMLDVARLDAAIASCPAVVQCASVTTADANIIQPNTLGHCTPHLAACAALGGTPACTYPAALDWPGGYLDTRTVCDDEDVDEPPVSVSSCGALCPFNSGRGRALVGSLGPQPDAPACPDCPALIDASEPAAHLYLELEDTYEPGTTIDNPFLVISGPKPPNNHIDKVYIDLSKDTDAGAWVPGAHLDLRVDLSGPNIDWSKTELIEAALVVGVTPPGGKETTDYSPLRVGPY